ncbi:MAG: DUF5685 family protein [Andreesenia angusta]|nr:DUF5685 family protein [Andreesenia angusta]
MFGYVRPIRSELKVKDNEIFKAYYCGLCKSIDKENGLIPRFALNYDLVFLGIFLSSIVDEDLKITKSPCIAHPFKKRKYVYEDNALIYTSNIGTILAYFNLLDDWNDDRSYLSLIASFLFKKGSIKARKKYQNKFNLIKKHLLELKRLEEENCSELDIIADAFAKLMEEIADYDGIKDEKVLKAFKWLAYNLGRWIYILDAYDDIEEDYDEGNYNPIISSMKLSDESIGEFKKRISPRVHFTLTCSLASISEAYELIPINKNKDIIENIIYLGMRNKMDNIIDGGDKDESL